MKASIESTNKIIEIQSTRPMQARVWEGKTENGIRFSAIIVRIAVSVDEDHVEFERELKEQPAPAPTIQAWDARMFFP